MTTNIEIPKKSLLAVSGGVDSMALLHLAKDIEGIEVAHVNYNIREDSALDQELVTKFCSDHSIPLHIRYNIDEIPKSGVELWARDMRYSFFEEIRTLFGFSKIVLAHHADDQAETVIMKIMRGTGLKGLRGIHRETKDTHLIRPLLDMTKSSLYEYCRINQVPFREDYTNLDTTLTRNHIRHNVVGSFDVSQLCRIADKAQRIYPKLMDFLHNRYNHMFMVDVNQITIDRRFPLNDLTFMYMSHILSPWINMTEVMFNMMKSTDGNSRVFYLSKNIKCDKRSPKNIKVVKIY